jgi:membrane protease YdiL (CAAX protease family)
MTTAAVRENVAAVDDRPRLLPVLLAILAFPVLSLTGRFVLGPRLGRGLVRELVGEFALLVLTVAIVAWARWWRQTGLVGPWRERWWVAVPAVLLAAQLLLQVPGLRDAGDPALLPGVLLLVAMVGFCEETLTRGVMLYGLSRFGPLAAGLVSSAIFGLLHAFGLLAGLPVSFIVVQVITAALLGLLFAGLRLRMLSLWPLIVIHAAFDVPALLEGFPLHLGPVSLAAAFIQIWFLMPFAMTGLGLLLWDQLRPMRSTLQELSS